MPIAPVMIYGDDVTHVVTEEGIAYLYKTDGLEERKAAIAAIAGATEIGLRADRAANCRAALPRHRGDSRGPGHPSNRRPPDAVGGAASTTSWPGPAGSISRLPNSGAGEPS